MREVAMNQRPGDISPEGMSIWDGQQWRRLSEDGSWWWDGAYWRPVPGRPETPTRWGSPRNMTRSSPPAPPQLSPDGKWWWTGAEWVPSLSPSPQGPGFSQPSRLETKVKRYLIGFRGRPNGFDRDAARMARDGWRVVSQTQTKKGALEWGDKRPYMVVTYQRGGL